MRVGVAPVVLLICVFLFLLPPSPSQAQGQRRRGRALLIGIDKYHHPRVNPTPGAEADAEAMKSLILERYQFQPDEIRDLRGSQATRRNILREFEEWLIAGTQPGDRVFFFYAGHGSRLPDDDGDERAGNKNDIEDETLAPYDVDGSPASHIRDDEINRLVERLTGRMVVLVFDSCHSGTISRSVGPTRTNAPLAYPRYVPSPAEWPKEWSASQSRSASGKQDGYVVGESPQSRDLSLVSVAVDKNAVAAGVVVFSAAGSGQLAYPIAVGGGMRGAFTYLFGKAHTGGDLTVSKIQQQVAGEMRLLQQDGKLSGSQQPQCEVITQQPGADQHLLDQPLFGDALTFPAVALANPKSSIKLKLATHQGKSRFRIGEQISYRIEVDTPGYLYLLVFSRQDVVTCLLPNKHDQNNRIAKGSHSFPRNNETFDITEPIGKDVVIALVADAPLDLGDKQEYSWQEVFDRLGGRALKGYVETRGQKVGAPGARKRLDETNWQAASLVLETVR